MSVSLQNAAAKKCKLMIIAWKSMEVWDHISLNTLTLSLREMKTEKKSLTPIKADLEQNVT